MRGKKASTTLVVVPSTTDAAPSIATVSAPSSHPLYQPYISRSTWTFTQGFVLGQVVFILLLGAFIKYVVFDQGDKDKDGQRKAGSRGEKVHLSSHPVPPPTTTVLLDKVGYDMSTHPSESADWLNVLISQILQGYRNDLLGSAGEEGARRQVETWLNPGGEKTGSWLDPITVTSVSLGTSYPLLSNARIRPADGFGGLRAEVDLDYTDSIHLSIATNLVINFPQPRFAVLPVNLGIEVVGFGGTLTMQLQPATANAPQNESRQHLHLSLLPDFHLNVKATSLLGSRAKLQDIPKLEQIVISRLRQAIHDRYVWPRFLGIGLPRLVSKGVEPVVATSEGTLKPAAPQVQAGAKDVISLPTSPVPEYTPIPPGGSSKVFDIPERIVSPPSGDSGTRSSLFSQQQQQQQQRHQQQQQQSLRQQQYQPQQDQQRMDKPKRRAASAILGANGTDDEEEDHQYAPTPVSSNLGPDTRWDRTVPATGRDPSQRLGHFATTSTGSRVGLNPPEGLDGMRYRGSGQGLASANGSIAGSSTGGRGMAIANGTIPLRKKGPLNARGLAPR